MKPYQKFASVYDLMRADEHSIKMTEYCTKIFRKFNINPTTGLDLCCGTGSAIEQFVKKGIIMSGLDQSPQMLAFAAKKLNSYKVTLYQKSLPRFKLLETERKNKICKFDLITCFYDSLNYLKNRTELETAFKSVYLHLQRGGWFIFDMNTPPALKIIWGESVFADVKDNLAWIWKNDYSDKTVSAALHTTFFKKKGKFWERFDEIHIERAYENKIVLNKLRKTGFKIKGFYRCYSFDKPGKRTYRICAIVRKPL